MTRLDDDEALILGQARRGLGPTSADEQRVLANLLPQIALSPSAAGGGGSLRRSPWAVRIAGSVAVMGAIALSGGLGYRRGWDAGIAQQNSKITRVNAAAVASSATADAKLELAPPPEAERALVSEAKAASRGSVIRTHSVTVSATPSASSAPLGLDEEVRQLRRVERAIREGNPRFALVLLEELDQAMPAGQLLEERRAAGIMANCQLGASGAVDGARAFAKTHAGSAYLTRVVEICGLESERNSVAPGTHAPR